MRLQTILFPSDAVCSTEELYFHRRKKWIDFDGYFNLFYIEKHRKYSRIDGLRIVVQVKGASRLCLMHNREMLHQIELDDRTALREYALTFPYKSRDSGVFWFSVQAEHPELFEVRGYFDGAVEDPWPVSITAIICTYKREAYVARNLRCLKQVLANRELEAGLHLQLFLIDNGQSLESDASIQQLVDECGGKVSIFKNPNTGGAGGFTRGMLEALYRKEKDSLTHVLLMDDDALFEPDLFVRLYGFLCTLKTSYKKITVGGNLLREDFPYLQHASGEWFWNFKVRNDHILIDLRSFKACTSDFMCRPDPNPRLYSGWWCCCFPLETVRTDNLPLPLFLHYDDVEYGLRNRENGVVFLNGIGVWHKGFECAFAGSTRYYDVRNTLIATALYQPEQRLFFIKKWVCRNIVSPILEFRYGEAYSSFRGLVDFCKGPMWLIKQDPEKLNREVRQNFSLKPLSDLQSQLPEAEYNRVLSKINFYEKNMRADEIQEFYVPSRRKGHFFKKATWNGWFLPSTQKQTDELPVISAVETPYKAFRKNKLILFEPFSGKALLTERNYRELRKILKWLMLANWLIDHYYQKAAREYRERLSDLSSASAWESYLGLNEHESIERLD